MPVDQQSIASESKCFICLGVSQVEAAELALLSRIVTNGTGGNVPDTAILTEGSDPILTEAGDFLVTET